MTRRVLGWGDKDRGNRLRPPKTKWSFVAEPSGVVIAVQARSPGEAAQLARTKLTQRGFVVEHLKPMASP